jgi:3-phenylpropionate/trans-cinnamate dioxygenase ferredoxin subunit
MKRVCVANKKNVPNDGLLSVEVDGKQIALCHASSGYYAVSEICPHGDASLVEEGQIQEDSIICGLHYSMFDLRTGQVLEPPASTPLDTYRVVEESDNLYIELED